MFGKKKLPVDSVMSVAKEAFRLGYRSAISDCMSGAVVVKQTEKGYIVEGKADVPKNPAADRRQGD